MRVIWGPCMVRAWKAAQLGTQLALAKATAMATAMVIASAMTRAICCDAG